MKHSAEYEARLRSPEWQRLKIDMLVKQHGKCARCRRYLPNSLELHHLHYDTLGSERPEDVELLCATCHPPADEARAGSTATRHCWRRADAWAESRGWDPDAMGLRGTGRSVRRLPRTGGELTPWLPTDFHTHTSPARAIRQQRRPRRPSPLPPAVGGGGAAALLPLRTRR